MRRVHSASADRGGLDLHLRQLAADHDARVAAPASGDAARIESRVAPSDGPCYAVERIVDLLEGRPAIGDGQPREVEIDRKPWQVAVEQIDGRAALEREGGLPRDFGQDGQQQADLRDVPVKHRCQVALRSAGISVSGTAMR